MCLNGNINVTLKFMLHRKKKNIKNSKRICMLKFFLNLLVKVNLSYSTFNVVFLSIKVAKITTQKTILN